MKKSHKSHPYSQMQVIPLRAQASHKLILFFSLCFLLSSLSLYAENSSSDYVNKAWAHLGKREFSEVHILVDECIE